MSPPPKKKKKNLSFSDFFSKVCLIVRGNLFSYGFNLTSHEIICFSSSGEIPKLLEEKPSLHQYGTPTSHQ